MITDRIGLHSVLLPLLIIIQYHYRYRYHYLTIINVIRRTIPHENYIYMVSCNLCLFRLKIKTSTRGKNSMPFLVFRQDHLWSTSRIICSSIWGSFLVWRSFCGLGSIFSLRIICGTIWGSFVVQFGDHFRSGDHLRCCTVVTFFIFLGCTAVYCSGHALRSTE